MFMDIIKVYFIVLRRGVNNNIINDSGRWIYICFQEGTRIKY